MATLIEKNTQRLKEHALNKMFARQQQLNGDAGGGELPKAQEGYYNGPYRPIKPERDYMYGFDPWKSDNIPLSRTYTGSASGFGDNWDKPYIGTLHNQVQYPNDPNIQVHRYGPGYTAPGNLGPGKMFNDTYQAPFNIPGLEFSSPKPNVQQVQTNEVVDMSTPEEAGYSDNYTPSTVNTKSNARPSPLLGYGTGNIGYVNEGVSKLKTPQFGKYKTEFGKADTGNTKLAPGPKVSTPVDNSINWGKVGMFSAQVAPMLYNLAKGLGKVEKTRPNYNPYEGRVQSLMANRRFNIEPLLNSNLTAQAVANRNIQNAGNSRGELMSNFGAAQNYRMIGDASAWATKNNMDNQYLEEQARMDYMMGRDRSQMDWNVQDANARNVAARNQFLGQGFNDMGRWSQTQQLMGNQMNRDSQLVGLYPDMFGVYNYMNGAKDIVNSVKNQKQFSFRG